MPRRGGRSRPRAHHHHHHGVGHHRGIGHRHHGIGHHHRGIIHRHHRRVGHRGHFGFFLGGRRPLFRLRFGPRRPVVPVAVAVTAASGSLAQQPATVLVTPDQPQGQPQSYPSGSQPYPIQSYQVPGSQPYTPSAPLPQSCSPVAPVPGEQQGVAPPHQLPQSCSPVAPVPGEQQGVAPPHQLPQSCSPVAPVPGEQQGVAPPHQIGFNVGIPDQVPSNLGPPPPYQPYPGNVSTSTPEGPAKVGMESSAPSQQDDDNEPICCTIPCTLL